ncbi:MAG: acyl-CoA mutase large subunit family protein [Deferrisomatales bacterium]
MASERAAAHSSPDPQGPAHLAEAEDRWRQGLPAGSARAQRTGSGIPVEPLYTPRHLAGLDYLRDLGFPGEFPYRRGVYPDMYRGRAWTQRQLAGFGPAEETNRRYKFLLAQGADGVNGVFDYPTLRGYDSTDPEARADAGRGGVAIDTLEDMGALFDGIPVDRVSASLVTCQPVGNITVQSMYFANAQARGVALGALAGTSQNDFLMETAVAAAPECLPPRASFRLCCDAIEFCARRAPRWNPVSFAGYNYREAGCTAVQEVALTLANALACCDELLARGLPVDAFAPRLSFFLSGHNDLFEEVAKYRAARALWARLVRERYAPADPRSLRFRFHVQTAGAALTAQQPLNNVARSAYHALAAVLGGAQSVHVDGYDEALCTPTELSAVTALRTQQILRLETGVTRTADPLAGSYFVETLTREMEARVQTLLAEIEGRGGLVKAVEDGWVHRVIADAAYDHQRAVDAGEIPVVGVNCHRAEDETCPVEFFQVPETLAVQEAKLRRVRADRDPAAAARALEAVSRACESGANLMEAAVEAVKTRVTQGEVTRVLKAAWGTWQPQVF